MTIKHIVITGGGHIGISSLGILTETYRKKIWDKKNIINMGTFLKYDCSYVMS